MALKLIIPPAVEPVTLADAQNHCRISGDDDAALIGSLITAARQWCEHYQGRAFVPQTWRLTLDRFPGGGEVWTGGQFVPARSDGEGSAGGVIRLPRSPLQSVAAVSYIDGAGATQVLDPAAYKVDTDGEPGRIVPAYGLSWPATRSEIGAASVTFVAGSSVPPLTAVQAIKLLVGHWYENREAVAPGSLSKEIEFAVTALLSIDRTF